jgi:hypothetical protein
MFSVQMKALFGSRIQVELFDMPAEDTFSDPTMLALLKEQKSGMNGLSAAQAVSKFLQNVKLTAQETIIRDDYIFRNVENNLQRKIEQNPRLISKDAVKVFFTMGDLHQKLPLLLTDNFTVTSNQVVSSDLAPEEQCVTDLLHGDEIETSLVYRGASSALLSPYTFGKSTIRWRKAMNEVVSGFGLDDVRNILQLRSKGISSVHGFVRERLTEAQEIDENDLELIAPGGYAQYVPKITTQKIAGRLVAMNSLF